ncbi:conserved exported hypothetical protein [Luteimonas sp. 9C]|uniref:DUF4259 domain-containing protein n=1 Tax=Luteimonas sp. 9C TaxID=2653148 RepID=UPI0012F3662E|nr:DUF4259 domain-containing protein [Luteimonas sp. 9C]VXB07145.1 conserved exported hypothetical protein [Luteimonas sp. 9C]
MKLIVAILILLLSLPVQAGTWGVGHFDNDEALDRSSDWAESGTVSGIRSALDAVQNATYVEAPEAMTALVAAEIVAAAAGRPSPDLPDDLSAWIALQSRSELTALIPSAKSAISKVVSPEGSELYELWADVDQTVQLKWLAAVRDLSERLAAVPSSDEP